jgi:hypothetical protein
MGHCADIFASGDKVCCPKGFFKAVKALFKEKG